MSAPADVPAARDRSRKLSVRVGVGLSPFQAPEDAAARFWDTVGALESLGYDSLWLSDSATLGGMAPLVALAAVAARTERLKLGTGVLVVPPRNPVLLAKELATVDALSGGRLLPAGDVGILNIPAELEATAIPRAERVARLEEGLAIVRALWTGEPVTHRGRFWSLSGVRLSPAPAKPDLELWLGGRGPKALERVGSLADGWLGSFVSPEELGPMTDRIRAAAAAAGRSIDEDHYGTTLFASPTEDELPRAALERLNRRPELRREDHVAIGADALRVLLERFRAQGATKFVLIPIARDVPGFLADLKQQAIDPVEAAR